MKRHPLAIWFGILFCVSLSASALYWDSSRIVLSTKSSWMTIAQLNDEYRTTTALLPLPAGHHWPSALPLSGTAPDGATINFAAGIGTAWAERYWFETWSAAAVATTGSPESRKAALTKLPQFYSTTTFLTSADQQYYRKIIGSAQKGDCSGLRDYVNSSAQARNGE